MGGAFRVQGGRMMFLTRSSQGTAGGVGLLFMEERTVQQRFFCCFFGVHFVGVKVQLEKKIL